MGVLRAKVSGSWIDVSAAGPPGPSGAATAGLGLIAIGDLLNVGAGVGIIVDADSVSAAAASSTAIGAVELATPAEATAQTDNMRAVTPLGLADRVLTSRTISTTAPLTGGGPLTADLTLGVNTFTTAVRGVVPAPVTSSGRYLRDDGTWAAVSTGSVVVADGVYTDITVSSSGIVWNINANAVGTTEIANGAVTAAKVAADVATQAELDAVNAAKQPLDADLTTIAGLTATTDNVIQSVAGAWASRTPAQHKATLALVKADVGLGSVDNTSDVNKPISSATQTALNAKVDDSITITTTAPLIGGGSLTANRTLAINNDGITNTLLANMPTLTLKGNNTGVTGDPLDLTAAQTKTMLAITTADVAGLDTTLTNKQPLDADLTAIAGLTATTDNVIQSVAGVWASRTPAQLKTTLALVKADVGLGNVDNTSDANKPVSIAQQTALNLKADKTITISTTSPLTGGGDLSANRTFDISNFTTTVKGAVPPPTTVTGKFLKDNGTWGTTIITAGSGLIGGGDLTADRTINVGGGTGITVAVDTVGLDLTYTDGRYINTLGDTMNGPLGLQTPYPVGTYDAAHKKYVDDMVAARAILWSEVQNKPDPSVTVNLTGPVTGNATGVITDAQTNITLNIAGVLGLNTVTLASHTVGNYVQDITGTANQIILTPSAAGEGSQHILSLPQSIHVAARPTFSGLNLTEPTLAPFTIASLARVDNLNADMVDGKHAADFADAEEVEALLGDLWFQGLYNPTTWKALPGQEEEYPLGDPGTLPLPGPTATELRNGMYWVANDVASVGFIDSDASGRYGVGDAPVFIASGDWIIIVEAANVSKWLKGGPYPRLSDLKESPTEGDGLFAPPQPEPPPPPELPPPPVVFGPTMYVRLADGSKAHYFNDVWVPGPYPGDAALGFVYQWIPFSAETFVKSEIQAHKDDREDPHGAAGYVTKDAGDTYWMAFDRNFDLEIQAAIDVHTGDPNPHDQYLTAEEGNAAYSLLDHLHDGTYLPVQQFNDHVDSVVTPDPHPMYTTQEENDVWYAKEGHLHDDRYSGVEHTHPTYFYVSSTDVQSGAPAHVYIGSKDPTDPTIQALIPPLSPGDLWIETYNIVPTPPVAATGFTATVNSGTSVTLKWTAWPTASQVTNITIERSGDPAVWPGTVVLNSTTAAPNQLATFTNTGLTERTSYNYRIRATNAFGSSEWKE